MTELRLNQIKGWPQEKTDRLIKSDSNCDLNLGLGFNHAGKLRLVCDEEKMKKVIEENNPNFDDGIPDEMWRQMKEAVMNGDKDFFTKMMNINTELCREEIIISLRANVSTWLALEAGE